MAADDDDLGETFGDWGLGLPQFFGSKPASGSASTLTPTAVARIAEEVDDLAAITGDVADAAVWRARAGEYAAFQAEMLRDLQHREVRDAEEFAANDPSLAGLIGLSSLGLGSNEDADDAGALSPTDSFATLTAIQQRHGAAAAAAAASVATTTAPAKPAAGASVIVAKAPPVGGNRTKEVFASLPSSGGGGGGGGGGAPPSRVGGGGGRGGFASSVGPSVPKPGSAASSAPLPPPAIVPTPGSAIARPGAALSAADLERQLMGGNAAPAPAPAPAPAVATAASTPVARLISLETNAQVASPPGWTPSQPPPPGTILVFEAAPAPAAAPTAAAAAAPAPMALLQPPSAQAPAPTVAAAPGAILQQREFDDLQQQLNAMLLATSRSPNGAMDLSPEGVTRIQSLHAGLASHLNARIAAGHSVMPYPPLPPALSMSLEQHAAQQAVFFSQRQAQMQMQQQAAMAQQAVFLQNAQAALQHGNPQQKFAAQQALHMHATMRAQGMTMQMLPQHAQQQQAQLMQAQVQPQAQMMLPPGVGQQQAQLQQQVQQQQLAQQQFAQRQPGTAPLPVANSSQALQSQQETNSAATAPSAAAGGARPRATNYASAVHGGAGAMRSPAGNGSYGAPPVVIARPQQGGEMSQQPQQAPQQQPSVSAPSRPRPLSLAALLSGRAPSHPLWGSRMSANDVATVNRYFFKSLAQSDPYMEGYYIFALQAKARAVEEAQMRRAEALAIGAPVTSEATPLVHGSALDAVAVLTAAGNAAARVVGGRTAVGRTSGRGNRRDGGASSALTSAQAAASAAAEAEAALAAAGPEAAAGLVAAAAAATALPVSSAHAASAKAQLDHRAAQHTLRRQAWETSNHVLGRQESMSLRRQRKVLEVGNAGEGVGWDEDDESEAAAASRSSRGEGSDAGAVFSTSARADTGSASMWTARMRAERCLELVLSLQDSARNLSRNLRAAATSNAARNAVTAQRSEVAALREALASDLGLGPSDAAPQSPTAEGAASVSSSSPSHSALSRLPSVSLEDGGSLMSLLTLPKGKKLLARAVPMLPSEAKVKAVTAGLIKLPHFVASLTAGRDAEESDMALASALAQWVRTAVPPPPPAKAPVVIPARARQSASPPAPTDGSSSEVAAAPSASAAAAAPAVPQLQQPLLALLADWVALLHASHNGATVRNLLSHQGASGVISALLHRGEAERGVASAAIADAVAAGTAAAAAARAASGEAEVSAEQARADALAAMPPSVAALEAAVEAWRSNTEALGQAFLED